MYPADRLAAGVSRHAGIDVGSCVVCALRDVDLTMDTSQTYHVSFTSSHRDRGTVPVDGRGPTIQVYMEDRVIRSISHGQPSYTTAVTSTAVASSSYTITRSTATSSVATAGSVSWHTQPAHQQSLHRAPATTQQHVASTPDMGLDSS